MPFTRITALLAGLAALPAGALAQSDAGRTIEYGLEQRVRNENWDNILDFNDSMADTRNQVRYRTRAWLKVPASSQVDFFIGLNQETNQIIVPNTPLRFDEVIVDNAYLDIKRLFVKGLSLRIGRQDIIRGEGFLLLDGGTWDGSRALYFNAVDLAYSWKKSKLELIGISDPARDRYLPRIHDRDKMLTEWNEQALGAYYTDKNRKNTSLEAYYFLKKEFGDVRGPANAQFQPDRHVHTAGGRVVRQLPRRWSATGEFAAQWGRQHPDTGVRGWAGYAYARRNFAAARRPYASFGYWGFSGDDPRTSGTVEGWDPLFSRWPKWSEMLIYSQLREHGAAYWTNLGMWQSEFGFNPWKASGLRLT